ncbi:AtpZ/AtpI family protein [Psychromarinibacter sp. C21-152]|uniref:ATP synthase protein I n=1 Tax=Psychromarinibacter sediminicola TaxID=3033385 RepID=A0AAE3NSR2_9RHOB|nr:AtpZ/AtpI family protein [Psychromarinibacter sediminicola]MDF0601774.1 AtpZ/AtpI family protein [Psychromarinibacter sediminicola]
MTVPDEDPTSGAQLKRLGERIDALKKDKAPKPRQDTTQAAGGAELAWRMVIELVAGIVIGFGIGYGLDYLFGTLPILLVLFTLFGFAAGVQTMMRTARAAQDKAAREGPAGEDGGRAPGRNDSERGAFDEDED